MYKRDELDILRYKIDMHLLSEKDKNKLYIQAERLSELAENYKEAGYLKDAICEMKRSLQIISKEDNEKRLIEWSKKLDLPKKGCPYSCGYIYSQELTDSCPSCNRMIQVCSSCNFPNRVFDPYCRWCGVKISSPFSPNKIRNLTTTWFYPTSFEHLSPQPVMAGDIVIIPVVEDRSLLALKVSNGDIAWKLENVPVTDGNIRLDFYYPYLYIFSTKRVNRIMLELETLRVESIYNDPDALTTYLSFPVVDEKTHSILFFVNKGLLFHDIWRKSGDLFKIDIKGSGTLFPVTVGLDKYIFSRKGNIYKLSSSKDGGYHSIPVMPESEVVGPPVTLHNWIYFESFFKNKRRINVWSPKVKDVVSKTLPDTLCSSDDSHFNNPPLIYKDGVLIISCQEPKLYHVKVIGGDLDLREIQIGISVGARKVINIENLFSLMDEPYFISRVSDGFFYTNLEDTIDNGMEFFRSEMMSSPLVYNNRLILICRDGVRCYTY